MENNQKTLKDSIEFNGVGLHTGKKSVWLLILLRKSWNKISRVDLPEAPIIPADIDLVKDTREEHNSRT